MARVTHVKKAQQQYKMVPLLDEEGVQVLATVSNKRTGEQKTNKHGRPTVRRLTRPDLDQPLPPRKCDKCGKDIEVGTPYKWIAPKSGPYGGRKRFRHAGCPTWQVWEYSSSLSARTAQIMHNAEQDAPTEASVDDMTTHLEGVAETIRELAEEKRESAQNIEDGFGHPTSASEELTDIADQLDSWADEVEQTDLPEVPEPCAEHPEDWEPEAEECVCDDPDVEGDCEHCAEQEAKDNCEACQARDEFDEDQWLSDALENVYNCPV